MAILKFTAAELNGLTTKAEARISIRDQLSTATTATTTTTISPPTVTDRTDVAVQPPPPPPPRPDPPAVNQEDPAPQNNLIVESVTQRGDQPIQMNVYANLLDLAPPDSDPYVKLPQEYATQAGDNYYDLERPLDLVRFKLDRYWNILKYEGFFDNEGANPYSTRLESDNLPVKREDVSILNDVNLYEEPIWRQGNVAPPVTRYIDQSTAVANSNPFGDPGLHIKEIIRLKANDSVFVLDPANLPGVTTTYTPPKIDPLDFQTGADRRGFERPDLDDARTRSRRGANNTSMNDAGKSDPFEDPAAIGDNLTSTTTSRTNNISSRQTPSRGNFGSFGGTGGGSGGSY
jgi:hypothetical protein